jgi:hypothetical protein
LEQECFWSFYTGSVGSRHSRRLSYFAETRRSGKTRRFIADVNVRATIVIGAFVDTDINGQHLLAIMHVEIWQIEKQPFAIVVLAAQKTSLLMHAVVEAASLSITTNRKRTRVVSRKPEFAGMPDIWPIRL